LSVVFVDYDNIYLSLKRKNEEAARRFAKDAGGWLRGIETGRLITSTQGINLDGPRRIVLNRCYGNPSPRRNPNDNSTDMNSFPFVRHHFLRSGFEVVDCPPLTAQLKNSADIKMVMDVLDFLKHQTYFDEFVLLSGDADFTPVLHRLRAHARRTVVYANDHTATPYTAISDGEVRENDLINLLMEGRVTSSQDQPAALIEKDQPSLAQLDHVATKIMAEVASTVQAAGQPVPLEALADRAVRILGHDRTIGTNWAGAGSFRELLSRRLPADLRMSEQPPYYIFNVGRQLAPEPAVREPRRIEAREPLRSPVPEHRLEPRAELRPEPRQELRPELRQDPRPDLRLDARMDSRIDPRPEPQRPAAARPASNPYAAHPVSPVAGYAPAAPQPAQHRPQYAPQATAAPQVPVDTESPAQIQQSIARIHEACQAPPLSPPDYRALFESMAEEISSNGLTGAQTISNIAQRALQLGADIHSDDIRFVMEVVSEPDPWFEQGASAILLANRFRNYVIAQCRRQHMQLSATEIDLIEMWFTGSNLLPSKDVAPQRSEAPDTYRRRNPATAAPQPQQAPQPPAGRQVPPKQERADRWWHLDSTGPGGQSMRDDRDADDFPRIVRPRVRG
jgi:hypothetical protein